VTIAQRTRRELTVLAGLAWLTLLAPVPLSLAGTAIIFTAVAVSLEVVVIGGSRGLAVRRTHELDEREIRLRDLSYRIAFRLLLPTVVLLIAGQAIASVQIGQPNVALPVLLRPRPLVTLLVFVLLAPSAVVGWLAPDAPVEDRPPISKRPWLLGVATAFAGILLWWVSIAILPTRTTVATLVPAGNFSTSNATCGQFAATQDAGYGFVTSLHMLMTACWDGRSAYVVDSPLSPDPVRLPSWTFPYISSCATTGYDDFSAFTNVQCQASTDPGGTLHYQMFGELAPVHNDGQRFLIIHLVIDRNGHVLRFG